MDIKNIEINKEKLIKENEHYTCEERKTLTGFASFDKPWLKYYPKNVNNTVIPKKTMYELLRDSNLNTMNKVALRYFGMPITYKNYIKKINQTAKALKNMGIKEDEIIPIILPNVPESRILIYAINLIGAVSYPISPMLPENELGRIIKENNIENIFVFDLFLKKYTKVLQNAEKENIKNIVINNGQESLPGCIKLVGKIKNFKKNENYITLKNNLTWEEFIIGAQNIKYDIKPKYKKDKVATIIGTSGTTGISKGVCLTNENLNAMALQHFIGDMNFEKGDKLLDILIQSIGYGIAVAHYSGVCSLESILIPQLVSNVLPLIKKYKIDHFTGGPIHYEGIVKELEAKNKKMNINAKNMVSGGASLPQNIEKKLNKIEENEDTYDEKNVIVRQGLGCTENGGAATYAKKGAYKFGGVGIPLPLENMGIFEPGTDIELPYNVEGEICVTGPTLMKEYLNNREESKKVLKKHNDGKIWLHTCDIGKVDEDGQFYIVDRIKDIFMRRGFNVHPSSINNFIDNIDIVESCKVIGVDHPDEQTVPVAFIKLNNENQNLEDAKNRILLDCFQNLEETSIPYDILFVDQMPRNLGGKIDGRYLIEISNIDYFKEKENKSLKLLKTKRANI